MDRRGFVKSLVVGIAGLSVLPLLPKGEEVYYLHGDGVHDDSEALQAMIDGKRVYYPNGEMVINRHLYGGRYYLTRTLELKDEGPISFDCCTFESGGSCFVSTL